MTEVDKNNNSQTVPTLCRLCIAHCGVLANVENDNGRRKLIKVTGDPDNPLFKGYTCPKGRALPEMHNHEGRLLHSLKKQDDGSFATIKSEQAAIEAAEKIQSLVDKYGPRSVAIYVGTPNVVTQPLPELAMPFYVPLVHQCFLPLIQSVSYTHLRAHET